MRIGARVRCWRYGWTTAARNLAELRAAVAGFVERYNRCWRLEKLAYRTPLEAREEHELRQAA